MQLKVDSGRCTGHGRCYVLAPEVFEADDDGRCVIGRAEVPVEHQNAARRGAANCPEDAITIEE